MAKLTAKQKGIYNKALPVKPRLGDKIKELDPFVSTELTGTGSPQNIPHGLGVIPTIRLISLTYVPSGGATITEGTHTSTNIVVTVTTGAKFKVFAMV
jgi:hypothetical protein